MIRSIGAEDLQVGMVMALPMGRTATVSEVKVGSRFVNFRTEYGPTRVEKSADILIQEGGDE